MDEKSRLAAILYADIAGYTSVMQKNESAGMRLVDDYNAILNEEVTLFQGELVKSYGDSTLILFSSSIDAIKCAEAIQREFKRSQIPVRIGAHLGEVLYKDGDYYGDSINIASRLESVATSNSVLLSDTMMSVLKNKDGIRLKSIGPYDFKNVDQTIEVFALANRGLSVPTGRESEGRGKGSNVSKASREAEDLEKKKKQFSTLAGMLGAAAVLFIGFYFAGITPANSLSVLMSIFFAAGVFFYFTFFGFRFDVFSAQEDDEYDDDDQEDGDWIYDREASSSNAQEEKILELKQIEKMKAERNRDDMNG